MKTLILFITLILLFFSGIMKTEVANPVPSKCCARLESEISVFDNRLNYIESHLSDEDQVRNLQFNHLNTHLNKLESKFDTYFLWGYGTLITLILAILANAWFLKRKHQ